MNVEVEDPRWLSNSRLVYTEYSGIVSFYVVDVDPSADPPVGEPRFYYADPAFTTTSGRSYNITSDGGLVYVQGPTRRTGTYLRVIPDWVGQMKRAVDEANR